MEKAVSCCQWFKQEALRIYKEAFSNSDNMSSGDKAKELLQRVLLDQPEGIRAKEVESLAEKEGVSRSTLRREAKNLRIIRTKGIWKYPKDAKLNSIY